MKYINDEIDAILTGRPVDRKKCPYCGNTLAIFINGLPTEEIEEFMSKNPGYFAYGGCCVFGDDRDPVYYCSECGAELSYDLKKIVLKRCPLVSDETIRKEECRNYSLLRSKYRYTLFWYKGLICDKVCPSIGKRVRVQDNGGNITEGEIEGVKLASPNSPGSFLVLKRIQQDDCNDSVYLRISDIRTVDMM